MAYVVGGGDYLFRALIDNNRGGKGTANWELGTLIN